MRWRYARRWYDPPIPGGVGNGKVQKIQSADQIDLADGSHQEIVSDQQWRSHQADHGLRHLQR
jgi:hypothetical protein